jgi:hypothetical protein
MPRGDGPDALKSFKALFFMHMASCSLLNDDLPGLFITGYPQGLATHAESIPLSV